MIVCYFVSGSQTKSTCLLILLLFKIVTLIRKNKNENIIIVDLKVHKPHLNIFEVVYTIFKYVICNQYASEDLTLFTMVQQKVRVQIL